MRMLKHSLPAAAFAVMSVAFSPAQAALSGVYFDLGDGSNVEEESTSAPVSGFEVHYYDYGSSHQQAAASFEHQTLRVRGGLQQYGSEPRNSWITDDTEAAFRKDIVVPEAGFGVPGSLAVLPLELRFDGRAMTSGGYFTDNGRSLSSIDTYFDYTVVDLDDLVCNEGCRARQLVAVGFRGYVSFDSGFGAAGREFVANYNWVAEQGGVVVAEDSYDYSHNEPGVTGTGETRYSVSTGLLELNVVSRVGHRLRISASMNVFAQSFSLNGWSSVVGDFGQTFDADLLLPGGGEIAGETLGVYTPAPVPLPATAWLFAAGIACLGVRSRRRLARAP